MFAMRKYTTKDHTTHKLTTIGHREVYSHEQNPYRIVNNKKDCKMTNVQQFKRDN